MKIRVQKGMPDATSFCVITDSVTCRTIGYGETAQRIGDMFIDMCREMQERNQRGLPVPDMIIEAREERKHVFPDMSVMDRHAIDP